MVVLAGPVLCWTQVCQAWSRLPVAVLSDDISELFSDWAVTTLTMMLASPNSTTSPTMSLPLMVRGDSTRRQPARPMHLRGGH